MQSKSEFARRACRIQLYCASKGKQFAMRNESDGGMVTLRTEESILGDQDDIQVVIFNGSAAGAISGAVELPMEQAIKTKTKYFPKKN